MFRCFYNNLLFCFNFYKPCKKLLHFKRKNILNCKEYFYAIYAYAVILSLDEYQLLKSSSSQVKYVTLYRLVSNLC